VRSLLASTTRVTLRGKVTQRSFQTLHKSDYALFHILFKSLHVTYKTSRLKAKVDHSSLDIFGVYRD
jgi:hypothetical protein